MKRTLPLHIFLQVLSLNFLIAQNNSDYNPDNTPARKIPGMKLVWNDEFNNISVPDTSDWKFENGFVRNKELQWYQPDNAYCKNGLLIIEARKEKVKNPSFDSTSNNWKRNRKFAQYTSSSLNTKGLHSWTFGRFEIRARIDTSCGLWPAIWTLGVNGPWPWNGEIDLMEFYRIRNIPHIMANVAWGTSKPWVAHWDNKSTPLYDIMHGDNNWPKKFHIWTMDWNSDSISLFLDNRLLNTTSLKETINPDGSNPFLKPQYILLNLAIGENGGDPSGTPFPTKYEVDYVRVYQKD